MTIKNIFILILLTVCSVSYGQTFDRTFQGWWASTNWIFEFRANGTYTRTSSGHYGNTIVNGTYQINSDTVRLLTGFNETHGTVNEKYLVDNDTLLIDLNLRYDYLQTSVPSQSFYSSKVREVKYPQTHSTDSVKKKELENILNLALNSEAITKYYHFDKLPNRKLLIGKYYYLDANIKVDALTAIYKSKDEIEDNFFIEFEDINLNDDSIDVKVKLHDEGVSVWFYYVRKDGRWIAREPYVMEN
jgi:hypothetical protein